MRSPRYQEPEESAASPKQVQHHSLSTPTGTLLDLQRSAGNAATCLMLQRGRGVAVREHEKGAREGVRGHVLDKHVGKTTEWLHARAVKDGLDLATSFTSEEAANEAVEHCRIVNKDAISEFVNGTKGPNKMDFSATTKRSVGYGVTSEGQKVKSIYGVKVVFTRQGAGQWQILTAYPTQG
ncbi:MULTISPECIES: RNase A-like domain-containing protein [unclassified Nocardioides]|uniref:RNase A-like domain-containing protein n=1 Tax=unclassified Nocardioides TaxID=2615069 RepID=UPI0006F5D780|nr:MULTISPECIES: RNase A-like domain-containing protein [unclassified Nocardioides]KRA38785.1 hypothetical protein ASD81_09345 [Nocardioides sp. Root614]KRA92745.1 hypothetical protein ASD84_09610 [Nocardioides sp. Root682]